MANKPRQDDELNRQQQNNPGGQKQGGSQGTQGGQQQGGQQGQQSGQQVGQQGQGSAPRTKRDNTDLDENE